MGYGEKMSIMPNESVRPGQLGTGRDVSCVFGLLLPEVQGLDERGTVFEVMTISAIRMESTCDPNKTFK